MVKTTIGQHKRLASASSAHKSKAWEQASPSCSFERKAAEKQSAFLDNIEEVLHDHAETLRGLAKH